MKGMMAFLGSEEMAVSGQTCSLRIGATWTAASRAVAVVLLFGEGFVSPSETSSSGRAE